MKDDEKKFFITCYKYRGDGLREYHPSIRDIINILNDYQIINYRRCRYLLRKWNRLGFYNYGVALDLGWFEPNKFPERYKELVKK